MTVRKKSQSVDFGFDPNESSHHFIVKIPVEGNVTIEERFAWEEDLNKQPRASVVKAELEDYRWNRIAEAAREQFNKRIRASGHRSVSWRKDNENILAPHFGKELTLLAWSVEDVDESLIPNVIANWAGLEPEERWWLYTTANATFSSANTGKDRGWRKAIKIAFSENPVPDAAPDRFVEEPEPIHLPVKDNKVEEIRPIKGQAKKKKTLKKQNTQSDLFNQE